MNVHKNARLTTERLRRDAVPNARRELFDAMEQVAKSGTGPKEQIASIGCSIKWKK